MENGFYGDQHPPAPPAAAGGGGDECEGCGRCSGCAGWLAGSGARQLLEDLRAHLCRTRPLRPLPSALAFLSARADAADAVTAPLRRHASSFSLPAASSLYSLHAAAISTATDDEGGERPAKVQKHNHDGHREADSGASSAASTVVPAKRVIFVEPTEEVNGQETMQTESEDASGQDSTARGTGSIHFEGFDTVNFDTTFTTPDQAHSAPSFVPEATSTTGTALLAPGMPSPSLISFKRRASIALPNPIPLTLEEQTRGRRRAIFGESVEPGTLDSSQPPLPSYPKSPQTQQALEQALKTNVMFAHLEKDDRAELFDAMFEVRYHPGDIIIRQGDEGDNFYVIESGTCEVWKTSEGNPSPDLVLTIGEGGSFGELSLIFGTQRAATVKARTDVVLWAIHRTTYRRVLMGATLRKRALYESFLKNVPILAPLERYERLLVADALEAETFEDGVPIIKEGEIGDAFYIIVEGLVRVTQNDEEVARLGESAYFGEIALLTNQPRRATVVAAGKVKCAKISRQKFFRVMGPCQEVLKHNMLRLYPQYASQL